VRSVILAAPALSQKLRNSRRQRRWLIQISHVTGIVNHVGGNLAACRGGKLADVTLL
jgi:hypothetical protein